MRQRSSYFARSEWNQFAVVQKFTGPGEGLTVASSRHLRHIVRLKPNSAQSVSSCAYLIQLTSANRAGAMPARALSSRDTATSFRDVADKNGGRLRRGTRL